MYAKLDRGTLLVSSPDTTHQDTYRSVILVCEHTEAGSFGLMLNRPLSAKLPEELGDAEEILKSGIHLRSGGMMQTTQMMLLHTCQQIQEECLEIADGLFLGGSMPFLKEALSNGLGASIFLCFGYVGWAGGELEREFMTGNWFVYPASAALIFDTPKEQLWPTVLKKMGGKYASLSMIPEDLSLN